MSHFFTITLQHHNSPIDCARELFKPSKGVASLLVCNENILGFEFFVDDILFG